MPICDDTKTEEYHAEFDYTYTLIHIPQQVRKKSSSKYYVIFKLSKNMSFSMPLYVGKNILFSGQYITHRQSCSIEDKTHNETFFDIASYRNARLFRHIKNLFRRLR